MKNIKSSRALEDFNSKLYHCQVKNHRSSYLNLTYPSFKCSKICHCQLDRPVVEAKRRRIGNLDYHNLVSKVDKNLKPLIPLSLEPQNEEQIIQEKQQITEDLKVV